MSELVEDMRDVAETALQAREECVTVQTSQLLTLVQAVDEERSAVGELVGRLLRALDLLAHDVDCRADASDKYDARCSCGVTDLVAAVDHDVVRLVMA